MAKKRYDSNHRLISTGEKERADGYYIYRGTTRDGRRHSCTAATSEAHREKGDEISKDIQ